VLVIVKSVDVGSPTLVGPGLELQAGDEIEDEDDTVRYSYT
jgi:hypothetical protein